MFKKRVATSQLFYILIKFTSRKISTRISIVFWHNLSGGKEAEVHGGVEWQWVNRVPLLRLKIIKKLQVVQIKFVSNGWVNKVQSIGRHFTANNGTKEPKTAATLFLCSIKLQRWQGKLHEYWGTRAALSHGPLKCWLSTQEENTFYFCYFSTLFTDGRIILVQIK